ncbi:hypothetical protein N2152v2_007658 [Parachlorella kessleri]
MRNRLALKGKARADLGRPAGDGDQRGTTQGWVAGWAEELDQPAGTAGAAAVQGTTTRAAAPEAAAGELLSSGQLVAAFVHNASLVCVYQGPPPTNRAAVQLIEVTSSPKAHPPLPTCKPAVCLSLEAAAVLAGASVPDCGGGPCMPHLLLLTPAARLRLVRLDLEQRHAAVVWDMPSPQAPLLKPLVSIQPGPSVLLPQTSGELWVACKNSAEAPTEQPPGAAPLGLGGLWRLHRLTAEGAGGVLPCMLRPAWLAQSEAEAASSNHSWPEQAAPGPAAVAMDITIAAAALGAGLVLAADPAIAAAADAGRKHNLSYCLVTLSSAPPAFPHAHDHLPQQRRQQQHRGEEGCQLLLTNLMLSADGCPVSSRGAAVQCWEAPAGLAVAPMMSATAQQAKHCMQVQLSAPARQLHLLPGAGTTAGCLLAACGPTVSSTTTICILSTYPALEQLAVLGLEDPACICLPNRLALSHTLEHSQGGSPADGQMVTTALPFAMLSRHPEVSHQPAPAVPAAGASASYAFLPAAHLSLEASQHGQHGTARLDHGVEDTSEDYYTLGVLHQTRQQAAPGGASHLDSEDARRGLLKVVSSLQHRVDAGQSQLASVRQLVQQKQRAVQSAEGVLAHYCRATWSGPGPAPLAGTSMVDGGSTAGPPASRNSIVSGNDLWAARGLRVVALAAEPAGPSSEAGWQLLVELDVPEGLLVDASSAFLVAANPILSTTTLHHRGCWLPSGGSLPGAAAPTAADRSRRLQLSCMLTVQQQVQVQGAGLGKDPAASQSVDVGVVLGSPPSGHDVLSLAGADRSGFIPAGRVSLPWQPHLPFRGPAGRDAPGQQPLEEPPLQHAAAGTCAEDGAALKHPWRHRLDLVVQSGATDLYWLLDALFQQLGLAPLPANRPFCGARHQACYSLPAAATPSPPAAAVPAAYVQITWHSACFAELALQADDQLLLHALGEELTSSMQRAAELVGVIVEVQPSILNEQQAQRAAGAAGSLLAEVDACIDWVEALLREKVALGSQCLRDKLPSDVDGLLIKQDQALVKALVADLAVAELCAI